MSGRAGRRSSEPRFDRRQALAGAAAPLLAGWAGVAWQGFAQAQSSARPTPSCGPQSQPTPPQTAGPYFKPRSPARESLIEPGLQGERLSLAGRVLDARCRPVAQTLVDVWQADAAGVYDNEGFRLRGHLWSGADGGFRLETILPGLYPGRTRHLHLRLQPPGGRVLTTQLYFPGEPLNARDGLFDPALEVALTRDHGAALATFEFVLG